MFTRKELSSGDGMLTTVWGPAMWHFLHTMSFNYPENPTSKEQSDYAAFMWSLPNVLPCRYCRENLAKTYADFKPETGIANRKTFSKYVYDLHEKVNKLLKKKSGLTFNEVRERYEHFRARCTRGVVVKGEPEKGCTEPLHRDAKAKCILKFVPQDDNCQTFEMDKRCLFNRKKQSLRHKRKTRKNT